ncbi:MAG: DUF2254 domain-containing protein [Actinomycetota bacterium]|nr:DUF2254 domain-containing protein [Actinomycetota bacterium]
MRTRLRSLTQSVRTGFWAIPTLCVLLAAALAFGLVALDREFDDALGGFSFGAGPDGAREVLSAIVTSMITFTGLVFSITIVVLQLTSSQFSPRVLRTFLRDRQTQLSLGVFIATFVYAVLVLRTVNGLDEDTFVPAIATSVGLLLLIVSVGVFVAYIHHIGTSIQASSILQSIAGETRTVLERELPSGGPPPPVVVRPAGTPVAVLPAPRSGALVQVDIASLVGVADDCDVVLVSRVHLGDFVPEGAPLLEVHRGNADSLDAAGALRAFSFARERTMEQDVAFGFRQLADIAAKALSPSLNDPTTAVQALDGMHDLLRRLATRHLPTGVHADDAGRPRLYLPQPCFEDYLTLALQEADQYGADSRQVQDRITALLTDVRAAALPEHRPPLDALLAERS